MHPLSPSYGSPYQIFSGHAPFSDIPDAAVILKLSQQKRPKKPEGAVQLGLTSPIWETVEMCWKTRPSDRLNVTQVLNIWEKEIDGMGPPAATEQQDEEQRPQGISGSAGDEKTSSLFLYLQLPQADWFDFRRKSSLVEAVPLWVRQAACSMTCLD